MTNLFPFLNSWLITRFYDLYIVQINIYIYIYLSEFVCACLLICVYMYISFPNETKLK